MLIFHNRRRDLLAKSLFDVGKLTAVASCVSGFFPSFPRNNMGVYTALYGILTVIAFAAIMWCIDKYRMTHPPKQHK